ncbi:MAG: T9SS type A sorting domain-containing protein, partial [Bacteroidetes bacterium]|nr:T9SS type A sorting domain-containing protein [Bacteroidota bacterium]
PNPASDFLNIVIEAPIEEAITLVLADANGKILKELTTAKSISELDISTFASGPMFLRITTQSGYSRTLKIQKIKK